MAGESSACEVYRARRLTELLLSVYQQTEATLLHTDLRMYHETSSPCLAMNPWDATDLFLVVKVTYKLKNLAGHLCFDKKCATHDIEFLTFIIVVAVVSTSICENIHV